MAVLVPLVLVAGLGTGCSGDDEPDPQPRPSGGARAPGEDTLRTTATIASVTGRLPDKERQRVKRSVTEVVDRWVDAAYLGDPRAPRSAKALGRTLPGFTDGARREARRDLRLVSNAGFAGRVDEVEATRRRVRIDVLAVRRRPVAATARVLVGLRTTGDLERSDRVRGRLFLTRTDGRWRVFGYDLARGTAAHAKGEGRR